MTAFTDLGDLQEDDRITAIGNAVMNGPASSTDKPRLIAFVVDDHAKADRYVEKLKRQFPGIRVVDRFDGPVKGLSVTVRVAPPPR